MVGTSITFSLGGVYRMAPICNPVMVAVWVLVTAWVCAIVIPECRECNTTKMMENYAAIQSFFCVLHMFGERYTKHHEANDAMTQLRSKARYCCWPV